MPAKVLRKFRKLLSVLAQRDFRAALVRGGVAAAVEHGRLLKTFQFKTIVDIGANRGQFALVSRHCFPHARIIAFEPLPGPAKKFHAVLGHDPRVTLHQVAIGPSASTATMHVAAADDSSSLLPISSLQQSLFSGTEEVGQETIQVEPLASRIKAEELEAPALLKIDVQGYELPVLRGCVALLNRFSHAYVECSFVELYEGQALATEVIIFLREHGFSLRGVYNVHYGPQAEAIQADMLFARPNE
jgi:FkbM family methyltransferase